MSNSLESLSEEFENIGEIDLNDIFAVLKRNAKNITIVSLSSFLIGCIYSLLAKSIWEGRFQIVLQDNIDSQSIQISRRFRDIASQAGLDTGRKDLFTQVEILKSPSVLLSVFDFVKDAKSKKGIKSDMLFSEWKKQVDVKLKNGTTVLNISYQDADKDIIIPVLNKISSKYQNYKVDKTNTDINYSMKFYQSQIALFEEKSANSLEKAINYAVQNNLSSLGGIQSRTSNSSNLLKDNSQNSFSFADVELIKVQAENEIKTLNLQMAQLENAQKEELEDFINLGLTNSDIDLEGPLSELKNLQREIAFKESYYASNDPELLKSIRKKDLLVQVLQRQIIGILKARKVSAESRIKAAERPQEVLIKYRKLFSDARKDALTLDNLENDLRKLSFLRSRSKEPWELITNPTLLPNRIFPKRKIIALTFLLGGLTSSWILFAFLENKKGIVFSKKKLKSLVDPQKIEILSSDKKETWQNIINLTINSSESKNKFDIALILCGDIQNEEYKILEKIFMEKNIKLTSDLKSINNFNSFYILGALGECKIEKIEQIQKFIFNQNKNLMGVFLIKGKEHNIINQFLKNS